jgi:Tol biopolymer transport system component
MSGAAPATARSAQAASKIAFISRSTPGFLNIGEGKFGLYVVNADGSGLRRLTRNTRSDAPLGRPTGEGSSTSM